MRPPKARRPNDARLVAESIHERLRASILSADLRPNRRLVEEELAAWLEASRTPVREALLRLEQEGLVVRDRGWVVRDHDPSDIKQILESRVAVEGYTARLAAQRMPPDSIEALTELCREMEVPGIRRVDYNAINDRFHDAIAAAADNSLMLEFHHRTKMNYWNLSVPVVFTPEHDRIVNEQHRELVGAIHAQDGDRAEAVGRAHVELTLHIVLTALGFEPDGSRGTDDMALPPR